MTAMWATIEAREREREEGDMAETSLPGIENAGRMCVENFIIVPGSDDLEKQTDNDARFPVMATALEARLKVLEDEILRLVRLAAETSDRDQQDNYWRLAQDLGREARELRLQIRKLSQSSTAASA
jgi:hypothetical protein